MDNSDVNAYFLLCGKTKNPSKRTITETNNNRTI